MKAVLLLRVSTVQQDYEQQKNDLVNWSRQLGYEDYIFVEDKESGVKLKEEERLGLNKLKEIISNDSSYKGCIVYEISRLARTSKVLYSMKEWFEDNHINLHIFDKKYHLLNEKGETTSECDLLFSMYSYFATDEIKNKTIRTKRGKAFAKQQGKMIGKLSYGYTTDKNGYIIIDNEQMEHIKYLVHKYITTDISIQQLGKEAYERGIFEKCNLKSCKSKVSKIIRNKNLYGIKDSELIYPKALPSEWYEQAISKLEQSHSLPRHTDNIYYCKSLLKHKDNGNRLIPNISKHCYEIRVPYLSIDMNIIDSLIWHLVKLIYYPSVFGSFNEDQEVKLTNSIKVNEDKLNQLVKSLQSIEKEQTRLNELYIKGRISEEQYETTYNNNIKNEAILKRSKTLLEEDNIKLHKALESVSRRYEIDFGEVYKDIDDKRIKEIIDDSINDIIISKIKPFNYLIEVHSTVGTIDEYMIDTKRHKFYMKYNNEWIDNYFVKITKRFK